MREKIDISGSRVLLMMPIFFDYHKVIKENLEKRGAKVQFVDNKLHKFDDAPSGALFHSLRTIYNRVFNPKWRYAKTTIDFNVKYDYFICINGFSYNNKIIKQLKCANPLIHTILYLWDASAMFNWGGIEKDFDASFSFDPIDAQNLKINYLPNFYFNLPSVDQKEKNDIFFIGTHHGDRYDVLCKIINQLDPNITTYIKLLIKYKHNIHSKLAYQVLRKMNTKFAKRFVENYMLVEKMIVSDFLIYQPISRDEYYKKMSEARCIIDIQSETQVGLPHQMIAALAMGKKVITTNGWIVNYDFYDAQQIQVVDRKNPVIDPLFVKTDYCLPHGIAQSITDCNLDTWIDNLIAQKTQQ